MVKIRELLNYIEEIAPLALQESYDNSGLLTGDPDADINSCIITIDVTEEVVEEAIRKKAGLVIAHHPIIFNGLKRLTGRNYVERTIIKAIKNDVAIYAAHTNFDNYSSGVNAKICEKLNLKDCRILEPLSGNLKKLVTFIPVDFFEQVSKAVFDAGAGQIGNYDYCGYNSEGKGSFRGGENTNPFVGEKGQVHFENEIRFETIYPAWLQSKIIRALTENHPYEEVAYDIYPFENIFHNAGMGMIGYLPLPVSEINFMQTLKTTFECKYLRHTALNSKSVQKVAVCGGAGSYLLTRAIETGADIFVTSDMKYHQFFDADRRIVIADIGHYESEQFTKELFYDLLIKKFHTFAVHLSEVNTNPVFYF